MSNLNVDVKMDMNELVSKLAESMGTTADHIVSAYTELVYYTAITKTVLWGILFMVAVVCALLSLKVLLSGCAEDEGPGIKEVKKSGDDEVPAFFITLIISMVFVVLFGAALASYIPDIFAPEAVAIQKIIMQLRG